MDGAYHYPADVMALLIEAIPRLNRSKKDVLTFFRGAGTPDILLADLRATVDGQPSQVSKFEIARTALSRINEGGDSLLAVRREVIKRVTETDDFTRCWENDQMEARGLVAQLQQAVNTRDTFSRINHERERAEKTHRESKAQAFAIKAAENVQRQRVKESLFSLFGDSNAMRRGKALEGVLNEIFALDGMTVREAFTLRGASGDGVIEQIDGVVQLDNHLYLVEMKWWKDPLGPGDIAQHLVRLYARSDVRGIFISYTNFTVAALASCQDALHQRVVVLALIQEIVNAIQRGDNIAALFRAKVIAAMVERKPFVSSL